MKRRVRRSRTEAIKRKRIKRAYRCCTGYKSFKAYKDDNRWLKLLRDTPTLCSCVCCGNPRKWFGKITKQEIKAKMDHEEQIGK